MEHGPIACTTGIQEAGTAGGQERTWVGIREEGADRQKDFRDGEGGAPLLLQDVKADLAVAVYVAVVDARAEHYLCATAKPTHCFLRVQVTGLELNALQLCGATPCARVSPAWATSSDGGMNAGIKASSCGVENTQDSSPDAGVWTAASPAGCHAYLGRFEGVVRWELDVKEEHAALVWTACAAPIQPHASALQGESVTHVSAYFLEGIAVILHWLVMHALIASSMWATSVAALACS